MVGWSGQPINGYAPNKFLLGCITAFLLCWRTVDSSDWNDAPEGLASGSHSHRQLSKVRCRTVVLELDVPTIKVTDEVRIPYLLQYLCLHYVLWHCFATVVFSHRVLSSTCIHTLRVYNKRM